MVEVYPGNCTAQLIGDRVGKTAEEIHKELVTFMNKHKMYAPQIGSVIWEWEKMHFDSYLEILAVDQTPLDEVTIVLCAQMYKFHVCIMMQDKYWTTKHDYNHCTLFLAFMGGLGFYSMMRK